MDMRRIVVVVEDVEVARTALRWALDNILRYGDVITLLHVFCPANSSSNRSKIRLLRLEGYRLALSFKDICNSFIVNTNIEIIVTEGDRDGGKIAETVREIGAFALVVGLHDRSFLYRLALAHSNTANSLNCRVLAVKQPAASPRALATPDSSTNMDLSQIEIGRLDIPDIPAPKVAYRICPDPSAIIWRWRKSRRKHTSGRMRA
ncbi:hypothetical protein K2173_003907 [Erythroxylum novogranatense]|uniref:UspA domain-containing protein n=1 Tax=Erythroxylum novogranatense TaxID=1862640 RepID=A0AAV8SJ22_9ROSI|nr:hypothetical protein K2173_003907 [Erythroxylum novogranatense]